jgi:antitoxin (DNA-binding transcriptional repressor) of toxin-antitoxin stability system
MTVRKTIGVRELKNELSRVVAEIAETGGEYVVTSRDQPKAVIRAWGPEDEEQVRAERAAEIVKEIRALAREIAAAAITNESAAELVSKQRR